jgi:hypothetical protein
MGVRTRATLWLLALATGCRGATAPAVTLEPGIWGGDRANLIVTRDSARLEFDCASGWLDMPIAFDALGRFAAQGGYRFEVGPVGAPVPAEWAGQVVSGAGVSILTLTGTVYPPGQPPRDLGPFHLVGGERVTVFYCE